MLLFSTCHWSLIKATFTNLVADQTPVVGNFNILSSGMLWIWMIYIIELLEDDILQDSRSVPTDLPVELSCYRLYLGAYCACCPLCAFHENYLAGPSKKSVNRLYSYPTVKPRFRLASLSLSIYIPLLKGAKTLRIVQLKPALLME